MLLPVIYLHGMCSWNLIHIQNRFCYLHTEYCRFPCSTFQLIATVLTYHTFRKRIHSSGVLWIFWLLAFLCSIVTFRSKIMQYSDIVSIVIQCLNENYARWYMPYFKMHCKKLFLPYIVYHIFHSYVHG